MRAEFQPDKQPAPPESKEEECLNRRRQRPMSRMDLNQANDHDTLGNKDTIRTFCKAIIDSYTWNPVRNLYLWFGFLWGLPVPIVTLWLEMTVRGDVISINRILETVTANPVQAWFLLHPVLFAVLFGAMGTVSHNRRVRIRNLLEQLSNLAATDGLTGLSNRREFQLQLEQATENARIHGVNLTLLMIDLDHFKQFNDSFGHPAGDRLLQAIAGRFRELVRPEDHVCRYGGEEFAILLHRVDETQGIKDANRIRQHIEQRSQDPLFSARGITLSVGVAQWNGSESLQAWIERADQRLYQAKQNGRNRVEPCLMYEV